mgnify:CR=1 FL=1
MPALWMAQPTYRHKPQARKGKQSKKLRKGIGSMNFSRKHEVDGYDIRYSDVPGNECFALVNGELVDVSEYDWKDFDGFIDAVIEEYERGIEYLEKVIQAHLHGYWYMKIKYGQEEERFLKIAEKRLEELKAKRPSVKAFVVWEDFEENINCGIFNTYSDLKEWSKADYIFRILDVV